ncbi:hypothetical protein LAZ67_9001397 [Cordylochernes scorpioides]|uniref:Uncharacterized protein n=1 Tax=Cordylochernes scorpioides TaxID=51811 RepID=A0ABY6KUY4_9ARAC|nr:hypothetical protein LAZ67_9001397 [Cordylochernes scorpioides]
MKSSLTNGWGAMGPFIGLRGHLILLRQIFLWATHLSPDLQAWIFRHGLEDDAMAILASAKARIYRLFLTLESGGGHYQDGGVSLTHNSFDDQPVYIRFSNSSKGNMISENKEKRRELPFGLFKSTTTTIKSFIEDLSSYKGFANLQISPQEGSTDRAPIIQAAQSPTTASRSDAYPVAMDSTVHTSRLAYH